jgi:hypothetical protein
MQEIKFEHYNAHWCVIIDEDGCIAKAFCNDLKVRLTPVREELIYSHIKKNKLWIK